MKLEKITRRYDDACGTAHALELVGDRWALLVMRELMLGPRRFSDLRAGLAGISANVLTQRLGELEAAGILTRRRLPPPAAVQVYELTPWGYEAEPMIQVMGRWAARSPAHDPTLAFSAASLILSLRTMFDPRRAEGFAGRIGFVIGGENYFARIAGGRLEAGRGDEPERDATLTGTAATMAAAIYGGGPLAELEAAGALTLEGDRRAAERFLGHFPLPPKVGA
jgi:DNA-binding HxlR family transcriptional regulator